jgi:hypothetical protein
MYYNVSENSIQFSKNRNDPKYPEDDFGIYVNRKYSFKLAYDERVIDIKWYNFNNPSKEKQESPDKGRDRSRGRSKSPIGRKSALFQTIDYGTSKNTITERFNPKAVIVTNQRIYIVDKNLGML